MTKFSEAKRMIEDEVEAHLISAVGDIVLWQNKKYTVAGRAHPGSLWNGHEGRNADLLDTDAPVLLCLDNAGDRIFVPERETRIVATNPRYVMERLLSYLEKKGAIDWDQLDLESEHDASDQTED